jgi:cysteine desulfurase
MKEVRVLRDFLWDLLREQFSTRVRLNGHPTERLPNTLNISFLTGQTGSEILSALPHLAASTGSACHDGEITLSPVLAAMGLTTSEGRGALRFSLGLQNTREEMTSVAKDLARVVT